MANVEKEGKKGDGFVQRAGLAAGPAALAVIMIFFDLDPARPEVTRTAGVAALMAIWWMTEAVPLAVTALLPMALFPALGVMSGRAVAPLYFNHIIFLFIGGFMTALAMQRWSLHKRIALRILLAVGASPGRVLFGFMAVTAFLSMWISNTATTMMMTPIAIAVIMEMEELSGKGNTEKFSIGILLGVAYSASLGGIATLVGTPPNLSFARIFNITFPGAPEISFAQWFIFALPISLVFLAILWVLLYLLFHPGKGETPISFKVFREQYERLGPMIYEEKVVLAVFVLLAFLWLFRADISIGAVTVPGWSRVFPDPSFINDGVVAVVMSTILFIIPAKSGGAARIMDWETAEKLPWGIVLLFGGGFALASGFKESGLSMWLGGRLEGVSALDPLLIVAAICFLLTFLTELTSNTATAEMLLPVLGALAVAVKVNPLLLMIPGTLACSCAFMLPVATPPNAIVFGSGRLRVADMAKAGILFNLIGVVLITAGVYLLGGAVFDIDLGRFPDWAADR
ncbi:MAG: SLC13 family permease [Candidatus Nitrospinota bacterium M3_3B_026]